MAFIIFLMLSNQDSHLCLQDVMQPSLQYKASDQPLEATLNFDQILPNHQHMCSIEKPKGKGRPKGEKNSKQRQRRPKMILSQENRKKGHWSLEENKRYHWFLQIYNNHFISKQLRRLDKIFKTMALFIGSREAQQCRSHHQKMEKKYISFPSILLYLRKYHYGGEDQQAVVQDMIKNEIKEIPKLMNWKQLQSLEILKEPTTIANLQQQAKGGFLLEQPPKQFQFQQNFMDFFRQDYEHRFGFDHYLV